MTSKKIVQSVLLLLLGLSVAAWAVRSFGTAAPAPGMAPVAAVTPGTTPPAEKPQVDAVPATPAVLADGIAVIHFHGTRR